MRSQEPLQNEILALKFLVCPAERQQILVVLVAFSNYFCMLFVLGLSCAPKPQTVALSTSSAESSAEAAPVSAPAQRARSLTDNICRAYKIPEDFARQGCRISSPQQGQMLGSEIMGELGFRAALERCQQTPNCAGIATDWYLDSPFRLIAEPAELRVDEDSYACFISLSCPQKSEE